ncbi:MAG: hypothetical protein AAGF31_12605 [Planctomycetota bacterium]
MNHDNQANTSAAAKKLYAEKLRDSLEQQHRDEFVAIEPISGDYFLARTLSEAIGLSRAKYPERLAHALRVGHNATVHFGMQV